MATRVGKRRAIAVMLLTLHAGACTTWQPTDASPPRVIEEQSPTRVRVTRTDGEQIVIRGPLVRSDSIVGTRERTNADGSPTRFGNAIGVAFLDIRQIEVSRSEGAGGAMLLAAAAIGLIVIGFGMGGEVMPGW